MNGLKWWQSAIFYQIYPRSFADGNGDGIGDFRGMIEKLDYLKSLGVDALWLSPHYPSPQVDCGYDISDYTGVEPDYGTLADFKQFLDEAHRRGIRVVLDWVMNHTSDQHAWFQESRSSRDNPKRDWYIWHDPQPDGSPPNNWYSMFGGPAWEYDPQTQAYYYHFFFKQQPDLNWRNPEVKKAMFDAARFWLDLGVDGFRLDAIGTIFEDPQMPNHQAGITQLDLFQLSQQARTAEDWQRLEEYWLLMYKYQADQPGLHELMQELRALVDTYEDRVLVGEADAIAYYGSGDDELHLVFNFPLMQTERLTPQWVRENQKTRLEQIPAVSWPCNTLGNHDSPRMYSHFGDGEHGAALARQNLLLLLSLKGTPFLYNGEEIGMRDYLLSSIDQFRDTQGLFFYQLMTTYSEIDPQEAVRIASQYSRDKNRTPLQWANAENAGFSPPGVATWLPVNPDYAEGVNVAEQAADPSSLLNFYRRAIQARQQAPALIAGSYRPVDEENQRCLAFLREVPGQRCLVALNMTAEAQQVSLDLPITSAALLLSTHSNSRASIDRKTLRLQPFEACIFNITG